MPLFIAISGYFMGIAKPMTFKSFCKKKCKRLLTPIVFIAVVCCLIDTLFGCITKENVSIFRKIYRYFTQYWYLDCLLILMFITKIFIMIQNRLEITGDKMIVIMLVGFLMCVFMYDFFPWLIFKDLMIIRHFLFYILGYYIGENNVFMINIYERNKYVILTLTMILWCGIIYFFGLDLLKYNIEIRVLVGIVSSISIVSIIDFIHSYSPPKMCHWLATNSLGIYILHVPVFKCLPAINNWFVIIFVSLILIFTTGIITDILRKTNLRKYLLGES